MLVAEPDGLTPAIPYLVEITAGVTTAGSPPLAVPTTAVRGGSGMPWTPKVAAIADSSLAGMV